MPNPADHDVIVIGAGLAGLRAATVLARAGLDVVVLEGSDGVGGRQRTDLVDGFRVDRGFQVLNPAYPAIRRWVDVHQLKLHAFPVGVQVRRERGMVTLADPRRHPLSIPASLRSGLVDPRALVALAGWAMPALIAPKRMLQRAAAGADRTVRHGWDRAGFQGALRTEVVEPFLSGVLADGVFDTSDAFVRWLVRLFLLGAPGLPAQGIQALPEQLASGVRARGGHIRLEHRVTGLRTRLQRVEVDVSGADSLSAGAIIVAVGPDQVAELTGSAAPPTRGLQTWWFSPDAAPSASGMLAVDGRRAGPIVNTGVISRVAPSYAPAGRHLVQATCLLSGGDAPREEDVRRHLGEIWGADAAHWPLLRRDDIPHSLPVQRPPLQRTAPARAGDRVYLAGDHRATASIEGALVSGDRAARIALADRAVRG